MEIKAQYLDDINILIIDDSKTSSMLIKQQLVGLGLRYEQIVAVDSYQETIKAVGVRHYDILIMDYHLEQTLTGHELTTLLYKNRLIDESTGVLIISGDSSHETVLTSLSGKVKHFITKPINTKSLGDKINAIYKESELLQQIIELLKSPSPSLTGDLIVLMEQVDFAISLESSLIDLLIQKNQWETLTEYLAYSTSSSHPTKQYAHAMLVAKEGNVDEAINQLSDYIVQNPLSLKIMDCLANLYEQQGKFSDALNWALKGFELTPSISERAIHASRLAALLNRRECLISIGHSFSRHLSLADSHWLNSIVEYSRHLEAVYLHSERSSAKRELLEHFSVFVKNAEKKLTTSRKAHLLCYQQLFQCRIWIHEQNFEGAHKKVLQAVSTYYDNLSKCPATIVREALPILEFLGENWLRQYMEKLLPTHSSNNSSPSLTLGNSPFDHQMLERLTGELRQLDKNDDHLITAYEKVIAQYPYSTEVKMEYLYALRGAKERPNLNIPDLLIELEQLTLPPNWARWLYSLTNAEPRTALPPAFSISL